MRHFPKWITFLLIGFIAIITVYFHMIQSYRHNDITQAMNETLGAAITMSLDHSARVSENKVILNKDRFEENFKSQFQTNIRMNVKEYHFDYLKTDEGHLKSVVVKITDDQETSYQIAYISDIREEE